MDILGGIEPRHIVLFGIITIIFEFFIGTIYLIDTFVSWYFGIKNYRRLRKAKKDLERRKDPLFEIKEAFGSEPYHKKK